MNEIRIPSSGPYAGVYLFNPEPDGDGFGHFSIELEGPSLDAGLRVYAYQSKGMADLFDDMARNSEGWDGKKSWTSEDGELQLTCTSNPAKGVRIEVRLRENIVDGWRVTATATVDAGELETLAQNIREFVEGLSAVR